VTDFPVCRAFGHAFRRVAEESAVIAFQKSPVSTRSRIAAALAMALACTGSTWAAEFVYQGQLDDLGVPANGRYDLRIAAFGDEKSASGLLAPLTFADVEVRDGRFQLRFDATLAKDREAWIEVAVRAAGDSGFSAIPGRSKAIAATLIGACWSSTGDGGTTASNFLGTTDAQPLVLRTGNVQSLRIEPSTVTFGGGPITANVIGGSHANAVVAGVRGATIGGGGMPSGESDPDAPNDFPNTVSDHYGTIAGGYGNVAGDNIPASVAGRYSTVAGGRLNAATGLESFVAGGYLNRAEGVDSSVGGGTGNQAQANFAVVAGGFSNVARATWAMSPGGQLNCAGGEFSFAAGRRAKVRPNIDPSWGTCTGIGTTSNPGGDQGTFVWADSTDADFVSTGNDQFLVRADGGVMFNTSELTSPASDDVVFHARPVSGDADVDVRLVSRSNRHFNFYLGDASGTLYLVPGSLEASANRLTVGGGSVGNASLSNGGTWTNASSRRFKQGFTAIDPIAVLERVVELDISRWTYVGSGEGEHLGPVAEDFHAAFGLGNNDRQIATVDADGVALAAIQGLNARLEAENAAKSAEIATLRDELAALRALVERRIAAGH
jgi:hypothetical protein